MSQAKAIHVSKRTLAGVAAIALVAILAYRAPEIILAARGTVAPVDAPAPTVSIASTVEGDRERQQLAAYCEAWSQAMPQVEDLGQFRAASKSADRALQESSKLPDLAEFGEALQARIETAIGGELDPSRTDLQPIADELLRVAEELRE